MSYIPSIPSNRDQWPNVVLIGVTGSGKTTVGRYLAGLIGCGLLDLDSRIIHQEKAPSIEHIFGQMGEDGFRKAETQAIQSLAGIKNHVIVTGAGALENPANAEALQSFGPLIWLSTPISIIVKRLMANAEEIVKRPLLKPALLIEDKKERTNYLTAQIQSLLDKRQQQYQLASLTIEHSFANPEMAALAIKNALLAKFTPTQQ